MTRLLPLVALLAACGQGADGELYVTEAADLEAGLASCVNDMGRPDLIFDPRGEMTEDEIEALLDCTTARATP